MKLNKLYELCCAIEKFEIQTGATANEIIDALTGIAWDEEDAGQLKNALHEEIPT